MRIKIFALMACASLLLACATPIDYKLDSGSMESGTLNLALTHMAYELPINSRLDALAKASDRCREWGYAKAFDTNLESYECLQTKIYICLQWKLTIQYQCQY